MNEGENNGKSALIIVGGGYRSAYYFGVMKVLHEMGIANDFDTYVGISSGSAVLAYFLSEQLNDIHRICEDYVPRRVLYNPRNILLRKKPILNLDYLVDEVFQQHVPLDVSKILNSQKEFIIPVMHYETGIIKYINVKEHNVFETMKAAMSIPWLTRKFYKIDDQKYVDAGIADQAVVKKFLDDGYSKILVLVTQSKLSDLKKNWKEVLIEKAFFVFNPAIGRMIKYFLFENMNYKEILNEYGDDKIITISPTKLIMSRFENNKTKIKKTIDLGYNDISSNSDLIKKLEMFRK